MSAKPGRRGKALVSGILFWYPLAGVTYQFLHYLIGLRQLGWDVYYVEDSGRWVYDPVARNITGDASHNVRQVQKALEAHGFAGKWAFRGAYPGGSCFGMSERQILDLYRDADVLLNVTGAQEIRDEHRMIERRLYVESDPFALQVKLANGDAAVREMLDAHDTWFTFGENVGAADCSVPVDRRWLATRQPVAVELWEPSSIGQPAGSYNTVTTWHNEGKDVVHRGERYYWTKDREFTKYLGLAAARPEQRFELATDADAQSRAMLEARGFGVAEAVSISADPGKYRDYIRGGRGEFTVARDQYVRPVTGWFSDRSACYLAAGRPVITEETGFGKSLPTGKGLFAFRTLDDVLGAVDAIERDYAGNCRAALEIAREHFAADRVVGRLMSEAGL